MSTVKLDLASDEWVLAASAGANARLFFNDVAELALHVGTVIPDIEETDIAIVRHSREPVAIGALGAGRKAWLRTLDGTARVTVADTGLEPTQSFERGQDYYRAAVLGLVPAASAAEVFNLLASTTRTIWITKVTVSGTQTTGGMVPVGLYKRSAAPSGGTSSNPTKVPLDSASPASNAVVRAYTANGSAGASVGPVQVSRIPIPAPASPQPALATFDFSDKPIKLAANATPAENLGVSLGGTTVSGGLLDITIEWYETD